MCYKKIINTQEKEKGTNAYRFVYPNITSLIIGWVASESICYFTNLNILSVKKQKQRKTNHTYRTNND